MLLRARWKRDAAKQPKHISAAWDGFSPKGIFKALKCYHGFDRRDSFKKILWDNANVLKSFIRQKQKRRTAPGSCGLLLRRTAVMQKQTVRDDNELVKNARTTLMRHVWTAAWLSFRNAAAKKRPAVRIIWYRCCLLVTFDGFISLFGVVLYLTNSTTRQIKARGTDGVLRESLRQKVWLAVSEFVLC